MGGGGDDGDGGWVVQGSAHPSAAPRRCTCSSTRSRTCTSPWPSTRIDSSNSSFVEQRRHRSPISSCLDAGSFLCYTQHRLPLLLPHSGLRKDAGLISDDLSVTFSAATPPYPYIISYRRVYGVSTSGLFKQSLGSPLCGNQPRVDIGLVAHDPES